MSLFTLKIYSKLDISRGIASPNRFFQEYTSIKYAEAAMESFGWDKTHTALFSDSDITIWDCNKTVIDSIPFNSKATFIADGVQDLADCLGTSSWLINNLDNRSIIIKENHDGHYNIVFPTYYDSNGSMLKLRRVSSRHIHFIKMPTS